MYINAKHHPGETVYWYSAKDQTVTRCKVASVKVEITESDETTTVYVLAGDHIVAANPDDLYSSGWSAFDANPAPMETAEA